MAKNDKVNEKLILTVAEKNELRSRSIMAILKYLVREPFWSRITAPALAKIFTTFRIPAGLIGYFFAYVNYFRYYCYIA